MIKKIGPKPVKKLVSNVAGNIKKKVKVQIQNEEDILHTRIGAQDPSGLEKDIWVGSEGGFDENPHIGGEFDPDELL